MTNQKQFDVSYTHPSLGKMLSREVPASRLYQNDSGELLYKFNDFTHCEVESVEEVSQDYLDAKRSYFNKYGTACE